MLFPTASRDLDGIYITGQLIGIRLHPDSSGSIYVTVIGLPGVTGFDRPCQITSSEERTLYAPADIHVHDTRLECFAADAFAPVLRKGFVLELEPGMAPLLRTWLTKLAAVSAASKVIGEQFSAVNGEPVYHMLGAVTSVVARIVLYAWDAAHSVAFEKEHGIWSKQRGFMDQFDKEDVVQALRNLAAPRSDGA